MILYYRKEKRTVENRIRELRKALGLTQSAFGSRLGVKGNTIANYESNLRAPSDAIIFSICREFDVNEDWLRTGSGDMFITKTRSQEIVDFMSELMNDPDDSFKRRFIESIAQLSEDEWKVIEQIIDRLLAEQKDGG